MAINSYKDLIVWQKSFQLAKVIYLITEKFPSHELYSLTSQMRRAAISISSNIAEGYGRKSKKEYVQFLSIAYGSVLELETQLLLAIELGFINNKQTGIASGLIKEVSSMLYVLRNRLKQ